MSAWLESGLVLFPSPLTKRKHVEKSVVGCVEPKANNQLEAKNFSDTFQILVIEEQQGEAKSCLLFIVGESQGSLADESHHTESVAPNANRVWQWQILIAPAPQFLGHLYFSLLRMCWKKTHS